MKDNFKRKKKKKNQNEVHEKCNTRVYLFCLIGGQIMSNSSCTLAPTWLLSLFRKFKRYAWDPSVDCQDQLDDNFNVNILLQICLKLLMPKELGVSSIVRMLFKDGKILLIFYGLHRPVLLSEALYCASIGCLSIS